MNQPIATTNNTSKSEETKIMGKRYTPPAILHELELETRAGSPLIAPDSVDPLGLTGLDG
jgi:hypothetical protein